MKKKFIVLSCCGLLLISFVTFAIYITLNATTTDNSDDNSIDKTLFYEFSSYPKEITVSNSSEEFTLDCTNSDNFSIDKLSGIPINQSFCKQLYEHSKTLSAIKVFSRNDEEDYGFADKSASIVFFIDDQVKTLKIGGLNPDKTGYYFALDDLNDIAVVSTSKADIFLRNIEQYASLSDFIPYSLKSYLDDETFLGTSVQNCSIKHRDSNETVQISRNSEQKLCAVSPDGFSLDQDAQNQIENAPFSFTAKQLYCYKINQSILYSSGLSDPICTVAFKIHDSTHTIKIGAKASQTQYYHNEEEHTHEHDDTISSDYYVMLDDIPAIYTANESYLPWLNIKN